MLARYHPSIWTALLRNEKGDFARPLLVDAVQANRKTFRGAFVVPIDRDGQEAVLTGSATLAAGACSTLLHSQAHDVPVDLYDGRQKKERGGQPGLTVDTRDGHRRRRRDLLVLDGTRSTARRWPEA